MGVIDLRCTRPRMMLCSFIFRRGNSHVRKQTCFFTGHRPPSDTHLSPMCRPLPRQPLRQIVLLPRSVSLHGLRSIDLPREPARYRGLPTRTEGQALPYGYPGRCLQKYSRRCKRGTRLAHLRRLCPIPDRYCPSTSMPTRSWGSTPPRSISVFRFSLGRSSVLPSLPSSSIPCWIYGAISQLLSISPTASCTTSTSSTSCCQSPEPSISWIAAMSISNGFSRSTWQGHSS